MLLPNERTQCSIVAKLCGLATDYHFNDEKPIEEIMIITGLSRELIEDAIQRRTYKEEMLSAPKKKVDVVAAAAGAQEPTMKEVMAVLPSA